MKITVITPQGEQLRLIGEYENSQVPLIGGKLTLTQADDQLKQFLVRDRVSELVMENGVPVGLVTLTLTASRDANPILSSKEAT